MFCWNSRKHRPVPVVFFQHRHYQITHRHGIATSSFWIDFFLIVEIRLQKLKKILGRQTEAKIEESKTSYKRRIDVIAHEFHLFSRQLNRPKFIQAAKGRRNNSTLSDSSDADVVLHSRNARIRHSSFSAGRAAGKMLTRARLFPRARDALLCSRSRRSSRRTF